MVKIYLNGSNSHRRFAKINFSEIPMNFNGHASGAFYALSDHNFVDQNLHHFAAQMLNSDVLFNQFSTIITPAIWVSISAICFLHSNTCASRRSFCKVKSFDSSIKSASHKSPLANWLILV